MIPDDPESQERVRARLFPAQRDPHMCCIVMIALLVLWTAIAAGCSPPVEVIVVDSATPEHTGAPSSADSIAGELVLEACAMLEIECVIRTTKRKRGAVLIDLVESAGANTGRTLREAHYGSGVVNCTPTLWAYPDAGVIAHELGHVFGLEHRPEGDVDGPAAIMSPVAGYDATVLSDDELETVADNAQDWAVWCP